MTTQRPLTQRGTARRDTVRGRVALRCGRAVALGLGLAVTAAPAAMAVPDVGRVDLSVTGEPEATTLFGDVVVVPGHRETRSVQVANVGDLPGTLTVEVVDATLTGSPSAFFDDLTVNGVPAAVLDGAATAIVPEQTLAPGEVVTVPVTLAFDVDNPAPAPDATFTFAVRATLSGETPTVDPTPVPTAPAPAEVAPGGGKAAPGARTEAGGVRAMDRTDALWGAGALFAGGIAALIPVLRRRRRATVR